MQFIAADELARINPERSKDWIADQIDKEEIGRGWLGSNIKTIFIFRKPQRKG